MSDWLLENFGWFMLAFFVLIVGLIGFAAYTLATADWNGAANDAGLFVAAFIDGLHGKAKP